MTQLKCNLILLPKNYLLTDLLLRVPEHERDFAKPHVTENQEQNDYSRYVKEIQNLQTPCHWRGAFRLSSSKKFAAVKKTTL